MGECVICKKEYYGYGHNAAPVEDGKCCDKCNKCIIVYLEEQKYEKL